MIKFYPYRAGHPYVYDVKSHADNTLVFDGHFYGEVPVRLVMVEYEDPDPTSDNINLNTRSRTYIEIYEKIHGADTSSYTYANDGSEDDGICLFPTEITTIRYRVLKRDMTRAESDLIILKSRPDPDRA